MKPKKILVVNNDMDTMSLIQQLLETKGYLVKYSGSRAEVLHLLAQFKPDLLLIDILQMGIIHSPAYNACVSKPAVLMMTGYNNQYDSAVKEPDGLIKKPFSLKELEEMIVRLT